VLQQKTQAKNHRITTKPPPNHHYNRKPLTPSHRITTTQKTQKTQPAKPKPKPKSTENPSQKSPNHHQATTESPNHHYNRKPLTPSHRITTT
jgi:hypothetical protein